MGISHAKAQEFKDTDERTLAVIDRLPEGCKQQRHIAKELGVERYVKTLEASLQRLKRAKVIRFNHQTHSWERVQEVDERDKGKHRTPGPKPVQKVQKGKR